MEEEYSRCLSALWGGEIDMKTPLVSFCIPVYNSELYIQECLDSVVNQTYNNVEIVVCDDCSTDRTLEIIQKNYSGYNIKILRNSKNLGVAKTLNKCLAFAEGEYIARLDADDIADTNRIKLQVDYILKTNADICSGAVQYFGDGINRFVKPIVKHSDIVSCLAINCPISHPSLLIKREVFDRLQGYDDSKMTEDYALWVSCAENGFTFGAIEERVLFSRQHAGSVTKAKRGKILDSAVCDREIGLKKFSHAFSSMELDILSRALSGTNKLSSVEFSMLPDLYSKLVRLSDFQTIEALEFASHNWVSIGINNSKTGIFGYLSWLKSSRGVSFINKIQLFTLFCLNIEAGGKVYGCLKAIKERMSK